MINSRNKYYNNFDIKLSNYKYYDLFISNDEFNVLPVTSILTGSTLVSYFDFNDSNIYNTGSTSASTIHSLTTWENAVNTGTTLYDIGLTGVDNGLITFIETSGDTGNTILYSAMTQSTLNIASGNTNLYLNQVTGNTNTFIYPIDILSGTPGNYAQFCGGFYQGFYKLDGFDYQVFPNRVNKGWVSEFWLNKQEICSGYTGTTLNDIYPDNKGFFFYLGTRAENKFWDTFSGETGTTISNGAPLNPSSFHVDYISNKFLIYDRSDDGFTVNNGSCSCNPSDVPSFKTNKVLSGDIMTVTSTTINTSDSVNEFLLFDQTPDGDKACTFDQMTSITQIDVNADVIDNAIGFRIKDDGSIGYRLLTYSCITGTTGTTTAITVTENYSISGLVKDNTWTSVVIRFIADETYDDCELTYKKQRTGKLMIYIDGKLKFVDRNFNEFIAKRLNDLSEKQEGVPFNISIGGGSQGLIETVTLGGPDLSDLGLNIEKNFAGTFIGGISSFRFYNDPLCYCSILNNYNFESANYNSNQDIY